VSESICPESGAVGGETRPPLPQLDVPGSVVKTSFVNDAGCVVVVVAAEVVVVVPGTVVDVVAGAVVVDVVPTMVVVVVVAPTVVVVVPPGQMQPGWHSSIAPPGDEGGHVRLPGGSHCSPGSSMPFPHDGVGTVVVVVEAPVVVVEENTVVVVVPAAVVVVVDGGAAVVVVVPAPQTMSPLSQAAITPFQHGSQSRPPGEPHWAVI